MNTHDLTQKIKQFALNKAGFDLVGISAVNLPSLHADAIEHWVSQGYAGSMDYMTRDGKKRAEPDKILASAKSIIALAVNYYHPEDPKPSVPAGKVAKYAYGADYHKVIEKKLKILSKFIQEIGGPGTEIKSYVDTGPILEKAVAKEAGLGFFGKNTNIITKDFGSFVFLASLITNLELLPDKPHTGFCGSCTLCIDACPTDALLGNYTLDARRCIAYLTIESKQEMPVHLKKGVGEWIFGCDICQDVCPYNHKKKTTKHPELYDNKKVGTWVDLQTVENIKTDEEFIQIFQSSPVRRAKRLGLQRNAVVVRQNLK